MNTEILFKKRQEAVAKAISRCAKSICGAYERYDSAHLWNDADDPYSFDQGLLNSMGENLRAEIVKNLCS